MSDQPFETIVYTVTDALATIELARPEKRNAISPEMFRELGEAADLAGTDPAVRGVMIRAQGVGFCSGLDLSVIGELGNLSGEGFRSFVAMAQRPYLLLARMPKPTLAVVQGHAVGAGFQLALACDVRIASTDVRFAMLEARYGLIPDLGGIHHLTRLVGPARTKELVWSARTVEADEAERLGLVERLVDPDRLAAEAKALMRSLMAHSPTAAAFTKWLISTATETPLEAELEREARAQAATLEGELQKPLDS
jgi:2-(1,2-epoxy-1,2-dihydrophenyl)acetyl-CoA isomerase